MRVFARPTAMERLSLEARVVYTSFCLFLLAGYATSVWFYLDDGLGVTPTSTARYYLGEPAGEAAAPMAPPAGDPAADDGPALELPEETAAAPAPKAGLRFEKPARQIVETFHFHLFSVSVCLLILGHLFMMCGLSRGLKIGVLATGSIATFLHLLVPPLVRFGGPGAAFLMFPSALLMGLTWLLMTVWPVWDMWRGVFKSAPAPSPSTSGRNGGEDG